MITNILMAMKRGGRAALFAGVLGVAVVAPHASHAQWAVFDATNYAQNVLQATRALDQITNQIQALQNQAQMIQYAGRNLQSLTYSSQGQIDGALRQISNLLGQANGIAFQVGATESAFARLYPQQFATSVTSEQLAVAARQRWLNSMEAYRQTAVVQAQVATNLTTDTDTLGELVTQSQQAVGSLQAQQATNQLLALTAKQQLQTQALMASQFRAQALEDARNATAEEQGRTQFDQFIGSPKAYTPAR